MWDFLIKSGKLFLKSKTQLKILMMLTPNKKKNWRVARLRRMKATNWQMTILTK